MALGGLLRALAGRGATYPFVTRVTRRRPVVTRLGGAMLSGCPRVFVAPHGVAGVGGHPTATFRAVDVASLPGLESAPASGVGAPLHGSSVAKLNETVAIRATGKTIYFRTVNQ